ncbi:HTH_Tnp_Tc3_2 domain-containing protein [Trichonephila clavipes]|nr:HTH_Tnp_Tc3_2 domain-containing protein [Trichonephila clavipes]
MYITPRKRSKIIALNEHTSMIVRNIATAIGVGKSSVSRILRTFQDSGTFSLKSNVGANGKLLQERIEFQLDIAKINPRETNIDLRKDLLEQSVELNTSIVRKSFCNLVVRQQDRG